PPGRSGSRLRPRVPGAPRGMAQRRRDMRRGRAARRGGGRGGAVLGPSGPPRLGAPPGGGRGGRAPLAVRLARGARARGRGEVAAERHGDLATLCDAIDAGAPAPDAVLVDAAPAAGETALDVATRTLTLLQDSLAREPLADSRLVLVTQAAVAAGDGEAPDP